MHTSTSKLCKVRVAGSIPARATVGQTLIKTELDSNQAAEKLIDNLLVDMNRQVLIVDPIQK